MPYDWLIVSKADDRNRGRPEGSLFNNYYTEVFSVLFYNVHSDFNNYIFCWMSFPMGLMILIIKSIQYVGSCIKCYFIHFCFLICYAYCFEDL